MAIDGTGLSIRTPLSERHPLMRLDLRTDTYRAMSPAGGSGVAHHPAHLVILAAMFGVVLESIFATVPSLATSYERLFHSVQFGAFCLFTLEYAVRLWIAPVGSTEGAWKAVRRYAFSLLGVVDLIVILPFWIRLLGVELGGDLLLASLFSLVKLARFVPGLSLFISVFRNEARPLLAALIALLVLLVIASGLMYLLESREQPNVFASMPHTLWWGIVTVASVGYGDMTPLTPGGRVLAGFIMLLGVAVFAVPAGILASGFARELRKRDFLVTWKTLAGLPLFSGLDAGRIAQIARLLTSQIVPSDTVIVRRGDPAQAMFFIMEGEVEVELVPGPVRLKAGQYFGEIALLKDTERTASVVSITEVQLLILGVKDFRRLMEENPQVKASVTRVAEARLNSRP